jgi:hypothetical protein
LPASFRPYLLRMLRDLGTHDGEEPEENMSAIEKERLGRRSGLRSSDDKVWSGEAGKSGGVTGPLHPRQTLSSSRSVA